MWPYWVLFLSCAFGVLANAHRYRPVAGWSLGYLALVCVLVLMIGLRKEVGGDWYNYLRMLDSVRWLEFSDAMEVTDPAYAMLNWAAAQSGIGVVVANVFCAAVFVAGLAAFCLRQPLPWLALAVSVPYLVIVVAMGYSRQGVAIGLAMLGMTRLEDRRVGAFLFWVALAALFHKSAVLLMPLAPLAVTRNRLYTFISGAAATAIMFYLLLQESVDKLIDNYIEAGYQSEGAAIRVAMNALPAVIFLMSKRSFGFSPEAERLWRIMAWAAIGFVVLLVALPSSTAVDRMALYLIPIQIVVLSRLPIAWAGRRLRLGDLQIAVLTYSAVVLFVWLNYANNAKAWIPYGIISLSDLETGIY